MEQELFNQTRKPTANSYAFVLPNEQEIKALLNESFGSPAHYGLLVNIV